MKGTGSPGQGQTNGHLITHTHKKKESKVNDFHLGVKKEVKSEQ